MTRLILAGGGHAHLFVLEQLALQPRDDLEVVLITPSYLQYYSGMVPGWMARHYHEDQFAIDLRPLLERARITFIEQSLAGIDAERREVCLADGERISYDLLSLDIGAETDTSWLESLGPKLLPIKPLGDFARHWQALLSIEAGTNLELAIVGGGAAGLELALAAQQGLKQRGLAVQVCLVTGDAGVIAGFPRRVRLRAENALRRAGIQVIKQRAVGSNGGLLLSDGSSLNPDYVIAAMGSRPHPWLCLSGLELDSKGHVLVDRFHRSLSHAEVFAVGDACSRSDIPLAHSGVNAVRAGPVLAQNLLAMIDERQLVPYDPPQRSLYLLSCGTPYAIASWGRFSAEGGWVWRCKDWIDRRFIRRFSCRAS